MIDGWGFSPFVEQFIYPVLLAVATLYCSLLLFRLIYRPIPELRGYAGEILQDGNECLILLDVFPQNEGLCGRQLAESFPHWGSQINCAGVDKI